MIAIIGGGISGLSVAYFLQKNNIDFVLFEKESKTGGYIQTEIIGNYILENGPNSILSNELTTQLITELGLDNQILSPKNVAKDRFVFKNGKYKKLPSHPLKIFISIFFSFNSKIKILKDLISNKEKVDINISVKDFFITYFGSEITNYAVDPFMSGVYAGDISQMKINEIMPDIVKYKSNNGSIIRQLIKNAGKRKKTHSFKLGMVSLTNALHAKVKSKIINDEILSINPIHSNNIEVLTKNNTFHFTSLVVCVPAFQVAKIRGFELFKGIHYAPMAVVHTVFKKSDIGLPFNGFGGLHPTIEKCFSLGSIWSSSIFDDRCPPDEVLFTTFVGGMHHINVLSLGENDIKYRVTLELVDKFKISNAKPVFQHIYMWPKAIPQYDKNYVALKPKILELENQNIYICSNWHQGISLTSCIEKAQNIANKLSH